MYRIVPHITELLAKGVLSMTDINRQYSLTQSKAMYPDSLTQSKAMYVCNILAKRSGAGYLKADILAFFLGSVLGLVF